MHPPSFGEYWTFLDPSRLLFYLPNTVENKLPKRQNPNRKIHLSFPSQAAATLTGVGRGRTKEVAGSGLLKSFIECHCWSSEMRRSKRWARRWVCSSSNEESIWWLGSWCCPMASRRHRWERGAVQPPWLSRSSSDKHFMQMCSGRKPGRSSRAQCWDSRFICLCLQSVVKTCVPKAMQCSWTWQILSRLSLS